MMAGLPMTPSVAYRALFEQMRTFESYAQAGKSTDVYQHFVGPITPPVNGTRRPIGDPVFDSIADYASKVVARAGLLTSRSLGEENVRLQEYGQMTRSMYAVEHALAIDLCRVASDISLRRRHTCARATLAVAAFWCDRSELLRLGEKGTHTLLGGRPADEIGIVLWEHAVIALSPPTKPTSGGGLGNDNSGDLSTSDLSIGIGLTPAA